MPSEFDKWLGSASAVANSAVGVVQGVFENVGTLDKVLAQGVNSLVTKAVEAVLDFPSFTLRVVKSDELNYFANNVPNLSDLIFIGQFPPEFSYSIENNIAGFQGPGSSAGLVQWLSESVETITIKTALYSSIGFTPWGQSSRVAATGNDTVTNSLTNIGAIPSLTNTSTANYASSGGKFDKAMLKLLQKSGMVNIPDELRKLKQLAKFNKNLKRPPILLLSYIDYQEECFIKSISNINYQSTSRIFENVFYVTFDITLLKYDKAYVATDVVSSGRTKKIRHARKGDTYESIAAKFYGNPILGVNLRKINNEKPFAIENEDFAVYESNTPEITRRIEPDSIQMKDTRVNKASFNEMFQRRGGERILASVVMP